MSFTNLQSFFEYFIAQTKKNALRWKQREELMYETRFRNRKVIIMRSYDRSQICIAMFPLVEFNLDGKPKFFSNATFFWTDAQKLFYLITKQIQGFNCEQPT